MRMPDSRKDKGRMQAANVGEAGVQWELNSTHIATHCPVEIAQRRADSIRKQAIGQIGGA